MEDHFPDVAPLIGEQELTDMWVKNPRGALITTKASGTLVFYPLSTLLVHLIEFILRQHHIITKIAVSSSEMQRTHRFHSMAKG